MKRSDTNLNPSRRSFVRTLPSRGAMVFGATPITVFAQHKQTDGEEEVSTSEDLMREHGILKRVLLAYDEIIRRIRGKQDFPPQAVTDGATIVRNFIEDYHEKLEEDHLFPRFRNAGKLVDLVNSFTHSTRLAVV